MNGSQKESPDPGRRRLLNPSDQSLDDEGSLILEYGHIYYIPHTVAMTYFTAHNTEGLEAKWIYSFQDDKGFSYECNAVFDPQSSSRNTIIRDIPGDIFLSFRQFSPPPDTTPHSLTATWPVLNPMVQHWNATCQRETRPSTSCQPTYGRHRDLVNILHMHKYH